MKEPNEELAREFNELWSDIRKDFHESVQEKIKEKMYVRLLKSTSKARGKRSKYAIGYILFDVAEWAYLQKGLTLKTRAEIKNIISRGC